MALNLGTLLRRSVERYPDAIALIHDDRRFTFAELEAAVRRFAGGLRAGGFQKGQKVSIMVPNSPEFTIAYFGTLYAGGTVVALCTLLAGDEVAYQLNNSESDVIALSSAFAEPGLKGYAEADGCRRLIYVVQSDAAPVPDGAITFSSLISESAPIDGPVETEESDTAVIMYTSGTTGHPKGAELTHKNLHLNAAYVGDQMFGGENGAVGKIGPGEVALATLPLYHSFGQTAVQNALIGAGGTITYLTRFTPEDAAAVIARDKVTLFSGVPTMYMGLLHCPEATRETLASLKACCTGGAAMPVDVKEAFYEKFGVRVQEGYGLTETSPVASFQKPDEAAKAGTIGKPIDGVEFRVVDEKDNPLGPGEKGEICIRGHNIMKGYYMNPEATAEAMRNGWFHSGDVGYVDEDGDYHIVDRSKDMILRGGFNVYPREVEEVLYAHPAVREAAVIGVPDARLGEEVKAVVALKPDASATEEELMAHCKAHVAAYKYPRIVTFVDDLPKGPTGKILKRALKA